jgi:type IV pilus assembly protein PilB
MSERPRLGELLIGAGVIDEQQLARALERQRERPLPLGKTLLEMQAVDEETLTRTLARQLCVPMVWLRGKRIKADVLELVPRELVEKHRCLPVQLDHTRTLLLALEDPSDPVPVEEVAQASGLVVKPVLASASELEDAIQRHAPADPDLSFRHMEFVDGDESAPELLSVAPPEEGAPGSDPESSANALVLRAISQLLVEKGVIAREELIERLEKLGRGGKGT